MAFSVSSECAFSSAGITISKRHNRFKGDVVEALQILKGLICHDLLFRVPEVLVDEDETRNLQQRTQNRTDNHRREVEAG
ncbi:hypothetical protein C8R45DRAFT_1157141, partial [Mycena sanguinolenta]